MEAVVLLMVCGTPWVFGADEPVFEYLLGVGLAALALLWALRNLLGGRLLLAGGLATWCFAGLFLLGVLQLTPLPRPVLEGISPGSVRLHDELLPAEREVLPGAAEPESAPAATISLYPGATRRNLFLVLNVLLLFGAVRNNLNSPRVLRRLALFAFANGVLLALFSLLQYNAAASAKTLYWTYPSPNFNPFGPFPSRNTYAYYANLCFGLGLVFALSRGGFSLAEMSRHPKKLWACAGLAAIAATLLLCGSRGGVVSFVAAAVVCAVVGVARGRAVRRPGLFGVLLVAALALLPVAALGFGGTRLQTFVDPEALQESGAARAHLWWHTLPVIPEFPLFGAGYGTFTALEIAHRPGLGSERLYSRHAHNEFVEYLVEGGAACLLLNLILIAVLLRGAYRAAGSRDPTVRALALGGLFAFVTVVVHSFLNCMLHVPAVAILTTVVCAQLDALGARHAEKTTAPAAGMPKGRMRLLTRTAASVLIAGMGLAALAQGWRVYRTQQYLLAAYGIEDCPAQAVSEEYRLACLESAERLLPDHARLQLELGQSHFRLYQRQEEGWTLSLAAASLAGSPGPARFPDVVGGLVGAAHRCGAESGPSGRARPVEPHHLVAALRHFLRARDLCPLLAKTHVRIAANVGVLALAEPCAVYLRRARSLLAYDPELCYLGGIQELADGNAAGAAANWRRSLELSDQYFPAIVERSRRRFGSRDILDRVLPDKPGQLLKASALLFPAGSDEPERLAFLEKAMTLLKETSRPLSPEELYLKAGVHGALGQFPEAILCYETALAREPRKDAWRLDLARLFLERGEKDKARRELLEIRGDNPARLEAQSLLIEMDRLPRRRQKR